MRLRTPASWCFSRPGAPAILPAGCAQLEATLMAPIPLGAYVETPVEKNMANPSRPGERAELKSDGRKTIRNEVPRGGALWARF
jgi:hypothetical protein